MRLLPLLAILFVFAGCDAFESSFDIQALAGTYTGTRAEYNRVGPAQPDRDLTATLEAASGGEATLTLETTLTLEDEGQTFVLERLSIAGPFDENGARLSYAGIGSYEFNMSIDREGYVSGEGSYETASIETQVGIRGTITPERLELVLTHMTVRSDLADYPPGDVASRLTYRASRTGS